MVTGNPIRPELHTGRRDRGFARFGLDPALPLTYVTGGALGAHRVNRIVGAALPPLLELTQLVHQAATTCTETSRGSAARPRDCRRRWPRDTRCWRSSARSSADLYAAASLVVGRAGAGTVTELAALGLPAILVPLPGARGDEQTANARVLADAGAAVLLPGDGPHAGPPRPRGEPSARRSGAAPDDGRARPRPRHARCGGAAGRPRSGAGSPRLTRGRAPDPLRRPCRAGAVILSGRVPRAPPGRPHT